MAACIAIALAGNGATGLIASVTVVMVYILGIAVAAGWIGWSVASRLQIVAPQATDSSASFVDGEMLDDTGE